MGKAKIYLLLCWLTSQTLAGYAQKFNYKEELVPVYTLPEVLKMQNGKPVKTKKDWETKRRPEIMSLFQEHVFGQTMHVPKKLRHQVTSVDKAALGGLATRKEITIFLTDDSAQKLNLLVYVPNRRKEPVPMFMGLNFGGNQTVHPDPDISINKNWTRFSNKPGFNKDGTAHEGSRGVYASRWQLKAILSKGYGLATAYHGDLQLDRRDATNLPQNFYSWYNQSRQIEPGKNQWGTIGIWAWGLSRMLDYLEQDADVDARRVAVIGHSRLGKAAVWAGAQDQRFALVVSNNSGEGGAAIARRKFGETVQEITQAAPHWFGPNFRKYANKEDELPVDFHQLFALVAPRPLYVASSSEDLWADPKGEYLAAYHAGDAYKLYKLETLCSSAPPAIGEPVEAGVIGYHNRPGQHEITRYDWDLYLKFADQHLKPTQVAKR
ncbi:acetylxylan esterase [Rufibacter sp. XAAS-G3-1]|uniref:glucuronyl esterase domain-containing protein n=1 Tax=Rufibacter sp. XAAS-G3-1 TaxID=2729134 RepID=UPI0015E65D8F|nr:acetylxylan esterase [Rufibacter sp. XAAS-G3-1]